MSRSGRTAKGARRIWRWPIVLAAVSTAGLVSALLGDGIWDALSWLALSAPIAMVVRHAKPPGDALFLRIARPQRQRPD